MSADNHTYQKVLILSRLLQEFEPVAKQCGVVPPKDAQWYSTLHNKLLPQITGGLNPFVLIVAVCGGTNTGKSFVFNHLAGAAAKNQWISAVDYRASGTKHPVCLIDAGLNTEVPWQELLEKQFTGFEVVPWTAPQDALELSETDKLFWCVSEGSCGTDLAVIDTPDIDSDRQTNWRRAEKVRNAADVLIAVLTEQKYNDAAVRKFFREAANAGKPMILLFNMVAVPDDLPYIERWKSQFSKETGSQPFAAVAVPFTKVPADFIPVDLSGQAVSLTKMLTDLPVEKVKLQTFDGAWDLICSPNGVAAYLEAAEKSALQFAEALKILDNAGETQIRWAGLPGTIVVEEIRNWWNERRPNWVKNINVVYRKAGQGVMRGAVSCYRLFVPSKDMKLSPVVKFRQDEETAAVEFTGKIIDKLKTLSEIGNPVLRQELAALITGENREKLMMQAKEILRSLQPVDIEFRQVLDNRLTDWVSKNPLTARRLEYLDTFATAARPLITLALAVSGAAIGAHIAGPMLSDMAVTAVGGEAVLSAGTEGITGSIGVLFRHIQEDYALTRSTRFCEAFQKQLWTDVKERLRNGAAVRNAETLRELRKIIQEKQ